MSIASPQTREEFRQYILTKLGAPVLEINVADEQVDLAINDAFQYFNERNHFNGVENVFLAIEVTQELADAFAYQDTEYVPQGGSTVRYAEGMVEELQLIEPGSGYLNSVSKTFAETEQVTELMVSSEVDGDLKTDNDDIDKDDLILEFDTTSEGVGEGLTVIVDPARTTAGGLISVKPNQAGVGYTVGDTVRITGGDDNALFRVSKVKQSGSINPYAATNRQNNYITLPDDVVGVIQVMPARSTGTIGGGIIPGGMIFPLLFGQIVGDSCSTMGFQLSAFWAMQEYLALLNFLFNPPVSFNFNQRTHRLSIHGSKSIQAGKMLVCECMVKPNPDMYPDVYNDMWLKEYATALVKQQWGRNLTKFNQVQLPGGIVLNGQQILNDATTEINTIRQRFSMDFMDPPTAILVG